ncbi:21838_t:CDS:1, partial [Gigaspora margarita]
TNEVEQSFFANDKTINMNNLIENSTDNSMDNYSEPVNIDNSLKNYNIDNYDIDNILLSNNSASTSFEL